MPKVIVFEKDRKQDRDLSLEVRFSAKFYIRKLNILHSDNKNLWLQVLLISFSH